jgi:hypothetical protein
VGDGDGLRSEMLAVVSVGSLEVDAATDVMVTVVVSVMVTVDVTVDVKITDEWIDELGCNSLVGLDVLVVSTTDGKDRVIGTVADIERLDDNVVDGVGLITIELVELLGDLQ